MLPPDGAAPQGVTPHCSKPAFLGQQKPCGAFHCQKHGHAVRERWAIRHQRRLRPGDEHFSIPLHLRRRLGVRSVGRVVRWLLQRCRRLLPDAQAVVFVHFRYATDDGRSPVPHLHLLLSAPPGTITRRVRNALTRLPGEGVRLISAKTISLLGRAQFRRWKRIRCPEAFLFYLYKARAKDRDMPPDRMPRRGERFRMVYGLPRRR